MHFSETNLFVWRNAKAPTTTREIKKKIKEEKTLRRKEMERTEEEEKNGPKQFSAIYGHAFFGTVILEDTFRSKAR